MKLISWKTPLVVRNYDDKFGFVIKMLVDDQKTCWACGPIWTATLVPDVCSRSHPAGGLRIPTRDSARVDAGPRSVGMVAWSATGPGYQQMWWLSSRSSEGLLIIFPPVSMSFIWLNKTNRLRFKISKSTKLNYSLLHVQYLNAVKEQNS